MRFSNSGANLVNLTDCPSCKYGTLDKKDAETLRCADCGKEFPLQHPKNGRAQLQVVSAEMAARAEALANQPQPATVEPLAVDATKACAIIGCKRTKLWQLVNLPKKDARRIKRTSYGTYPVTELARHLAAELEEA